MMNNADAYLFTSQWKKSSLNQLFFEAFQGKMRFDVIAGMRPAGTPCNCMATILRSARDRLGSVSLTTDDQGYLLSQARYTPYGQVRWDGGTVMPTKFAFTGQRADGFGLMDYNARFYSPKMGRFISADSIIPIGIAH